MRMMPAASLHDDIDRAAELRITRLQESGIVRKGHHGIGPARYDKDRDTGFGESREVSQGTLPVGRSFISEGIRCHTLFPQIGRRRLRPGVNIEDRSIKVNPGDLGRIGNRPVHRRETTNG